MNPVTDFSDLLPLSERVGALLKARRETVAVGESSSGGLVSAALLAIPGASAYYLGGAVVYTHRARSRLVRIAREDVAEMRSSSEPYALLLAQRARALLSASWGIAETGAAGPGGNRYGDPSGHTCVAVSGAVDRVVTLRTGNEDRVDNMFAFARRALELLEQALEAAPASAATD